VLIAISKSDPVAGFDTWDHCWDHAGERGGTANFFGTIVGTIATRESVGSDFALRFTEPPRRFELRAYGLRNPRCTQCFQEVRVAVDQSCPFERIEKLIAALWKLAKCCPRCPKCPTGK
jgi:hypothetical protein